MHFHDRLALGLQGLVSWVITHDGHVEVREFLQSGCCCHGVLWLMVSASLTTIQTAVLVLPVLPELGLTMRTCSSTIVVGQLSELTSPDGVAEGQMFELSSPLDTYSSRMGRRESTIATR